MLTPSYVRMTKSEIQKAAKVKYANQSEKDFFLGCINRLGLFDISDSRLCSWYIKFVDISDEDIIEYIVDYEHLDLYYEKLSGVKIGKCKYCGKLFKQNKKCDAFYCYKHRGYIKKDSKAMRNGICIDCGEEFSVIATNRKKVRCDKCQQKYKKNYQREYQKLLRNRK